MNSKRLELARDARDPRGRDDVGPLAPESGPSVSPGEVINTGRLGGTATARAYLEAERALERAITASRIKQPFRRMISDAVVGVVRAAEACERVRVFDRMDAKPVGWVLNFDDPDPQSDFEWGEACPPAWERDRKNGRAYPVYSGIVMRAEGVPRG